MLLGAKRWMDSRSADRTVKVLVLVTLLIAVAVGVRQSQLTDCLSAYNDAAAVAAAVRVQAAAEDRKADEADRLANETERLALKELFDALAVQDQAATKAAFAKLVTTYQATDRARTATALQRADNERKRAENPPPPPPSLRCG